MVKVHLDLHHITVQGHAPRADNEAPGQNIVCAAISALTLTLIEGLEAIAGLTIKASGDPGDIRIEWEDMNDLGEALIDTWYIGIIRIRDSYDNTVLII